MPDDAIFVQSARGEVRIATELVIDPTFGPVHLFRTSGGAAGPGGGLTDAELRAAAVVTDPVDRMARLLGHVVVDSMPAGGAGLTDLELRATPVPVDVSDWPALFGSVQSGAWNVGVNNFPAGFNVNNWPATQPVSGTFWQATQPVSGPVTDAQLRAVPVPVSGPLTDAQLRASAIAVSMAAASSIFKGRANTWNTPGRAGTAGQKILSIYNGAASAVKLYVSRVLVDLAVTVVKAVTIAPFPIRLYKVTVVPTNGLALAKNKISGSGASDAAVVIRGDANSDNVVATSALTATLPAGAIITQEYAPRLITGAGYEMADRIEFLDDTEVELLPNEGLVLHLEYTLATQNPTTDRWIAGLEWSERT